MPRRIFVACGSVFLFVLITCITQVRSELTSRAVATAPNVRITTKNPREINVGKPAKFVITVANEGRTAATGVSLAIDIPQHVELTESSVEPTRVSPGVYKFDIGDLLPDSVYQLTLVAIPNTKDAINLDSTVIFAASSRSSVLVRRPELSVTAKVAPRAAIGSEVNWKVTVSNIGDGQADDVLLTPTNLKGAIEGKSLAKSVKIGSLKPGQSKQICFPVIALERGRVTARFEGTNPDGLHAFDDSGFHVLQAELSISAAGPQIQPISREDTYEVLVTNSGDLPAASAMISVKVPSGLEVIEAAKYAYDSNTRTLRWRVEKLPVDTTAPVQFRARSTVAGDQTITATVQSAGTRDAVATHTTLVISRPIPVVTVINEDEFSLVGAPINFQVVIANAGSKSADDLRVRVAMPEGLEAVKSSKYRVTAGTIEFPAKQLKAGQKIVLAFQAVGDRVGEHQIRVKLDDMALVHELSFEGSAFCYLPDDESGEIRTALFSKRLR